MHDFRNPLGCSRLQIIIKLKCIENKSLHYIDKRGTCGRDDVLSGLVLCKSIGFSVLFHILQIVDASNECEHQYHTTNTACETMSVWRSVNILGQCTFIAQSKLDSDITWNRSASHMRICTTCDNIWEIIVTFTLTVQYKGSSSESSLNIQLASFYEGGENTLAKYYYNTPIAVRRFELEWKRLIITTATNTLRICRTQKATDNGGRGLPTNPTT